MRSRNPNISIKSHAKTFKIPRITKKFQMQSHSEISETFENNDIKSKPTIMELLFKLEQIIFNLTQDNFELTIDQTMKLFDLDFPYSYNKIISNLVYFAFYSNNELNIYLNYLETIQIKEKEIQKNVTNITKIFSNHISKIGSQESYYLLEEMIRRNLIDSNITKNIRSFYFMHYKVNPDIYAKFYISPHEAFFTYEELSKNDFELHKQLIKKGVNPNEIAKIIRNDEIEKLQEISSQNDFDFNQTIPKSVYERCSFINQRNVTLIDYAAFFSSIKCFKYLLMNGASVGNTGKYAIASGNVEIFHLCEQNHSSFEESYETAIQFHQNDVFKYVYENKLEQIYENAQYLIRKFSSKGHSCPVNINDLGCLCIKTGNYEIFSFLQGVGLKINDSIIDEAAKVGNLYLVKYFLQNNQTPKDIFIFSSESGNIELVKYVFELKEININAMYNSKLYLMLILMFYLQMIFGNYINY